MPTSPPKQPRTDGQVTGLAGELFVAAELLRRDIQTSITFGNAKAIDLLAYNPRTRRNFNVQVKALRKANVFPISHSRIQTQHIYVFVVLNEPGRPVEYFIVPGNLLAAEPDRFSKWFTDPKFPGINVKHLRAFADAWDVFEEPVVSGRGDR